jgi:hypothetical protein
MHRLATVLLGSFVGALGAGACGSGGVTCSPSFIPCGGNVVGTWAVQAACGFGSVATTTCPSALLDLTVHVSGSYSFDTVPIYSRSLTIDAAGTATIPASCLGSAQSCADLDTTNTAGGLTLQTSCSGATACTCSISDSGSLTEGGVYTTSGNDVSMTPLGGMTGTPVGYCVSGSQLQLGVGGSNGAYLVLTRQ